MAKVRIREERMPNIGDKFASRAGQKGTVGVLIREQDMPFTAEGIRPDIIINPHAIPSRMTIGQLVETLTGKACTLYGAFGDCTAFTNTGPKEKRFGALLVNQGYHSSGTEILYNGMTGEQIQSDIYIGPTYYMRLKHMVKDKINYRARGPRTLLTRQTVQGRANDGGLRVGEMERDGIIAHGISHFLEESMMVRGDEYYMAICNKTGTIAIYNSMRDLFISPMADGPIKFTGNLLSEMNIDKITRFGRSFSIVRVPYSFKLLIHELMTMNVTMRIITEDNIDQLESMSYSKTINKLMYNDGPDVTNSEVIESIIEKNKTNSTTGYFVSKTARKGELASRQENTNAILLDNQKAQEQMLKDIENLGWRLDERVLVSELTREGEGAAAASAAGPKEGESTPGKYRYTFTSLILDGNGSPTEIWDGGAEGYGTFPTTHPVGWSDKDLVYHDGTRIPDEVMANELARNQTPNNWMSSYVNIFQEYQKILYKKQIMEQAKEQAEAGVLAGDAGAGLSPDFVSSPGYTASSPVYAVSSPGYTASSPVYGQNVVAPGQLSYGAMAMGAEGQTPSPISSPMVRLGNVLTPVQMVQPTSPMYTSIITPPPSAQASPEQSPQSSILEVKAPEKKDSSDDGGGGQAVGSKMVTISASAL